MVFGAKHGVVVPLNSSLLSEEHIEVDRGFVTRQSSVVTGGHEERRLGGFLRLSDMGFCDRCSLK